MYLPPDAMEATLREVVAAAAGRDGARPVRVVFAERFPGATDARERGGDDAEREAARAWLGRVGLTSLDEWRPKPGLARHMGVASNRAWEALAERGAGAAP